MRGISSNKFELPASRQESFPQGEDSACSLWRVESTISSKRMNL